MKSALLVIDVQTSMIDTASRDLPRRIAEFINNNKDRFDYILFFKFMNKKGSNWIKVLEWEGMLNKSETRIAPELQKYLRKDNIFIKKAAFSVFRVKKFSDFISTFKISKLFMCGMDTDVCIYTSAMEGFERGYEVKVIEDLCSVSHGLDYHKNALKSLKRNLSKKSVILSSDI